MKISSTNRQSVSVFAILSWSLHGYLRHLYKLFSFHKILFEYKHEPEFFFYIPEHFLARLNSKIKTYNQIESKQKYAWSRFAEKF
jgi:hypothetical protein